MTRIGEATLKTAGGAAIWSGRRQVALPSLALSALQVAVAAAVASGPAREVVDALL